MNKFKSIRFKISVFYTVALGIILLVYTAILYFGLRYTLYQDLDHELVVKAQEISNAINSYLDALGYNQKGLNFALERIIRSEGAHPNEAKIAEAEKLWLATWKKYDIMHDYVNFASSSGEIIISSHNLSGELLTYFMRGVTATPIKAISYRNIDFKDSRVRVVTIPYRYQNKKTFAIQVGVSHEPILRILYGRLAIILVTIPVILFFSSFIGLAIARRILKPVMEVTRIARNITYKDLSVRVKTTHADQELQYLVDAFNEMISRLDTSFRHIAEFSSNVAHELKTPLTIIRGESELALMQERDIEEYKRVIRINLEETERMLKVVEDLLLLSKLDYQPEVFKLEQFDFIPFVKGLLMHTQKICVSKNIAVQFSIPNGPVLINADALHLRRMFLNLLGNAAKFTLPGGVVSLTVQVEPKRMKVAITDTGVGILPEDMENIFDRFFHVDRSGQEGITGSGLGLSIAQSIAKIHRGEISVKSTPHQGSTFTVTLPL